MTWWRRLLRGWILVPVMLLGSCAALVPVSWRLADPLVNQPYRPGTSMPVLLIWPDRIEIRHVRDTAEVSPRPWDAGYEFLVPVARRAWVQEQVRGYPSRDPDASWLVRVQDLEPGRQRIQVELFGDGIRGVVYEASDHAITPLETRLTGAGFAYRVSAVHLALWVGTWAVVYLVFRVWRRRIANHRSAVA